MGRHEEDNTRKVTIGEGAGNEVCGGEGAIDQMEEDYLDVESTLWIDCWTVLHNLRIT